MIKKRLRQIPAFSFLENPISFLRDMQNRQGDVYRTKIAHKKFVFVFHPQMANEILTKKQGIYKQNRYIYDRIKPVTGNNGLVQLEGTKSTQARLKSRPLFDAEAFQRAEKIIHSFTDQMLLNLEQDQGVAIVPLMTNLILRTAFKIFLDIESNDLIEKIGEKFLNLNKACGKRMRSFFSFPLWIPTKTNREILKTKKAVRRYLMEYFAKNEIQPEKSLSQIFQDDPDRLDHCLTFLFAGHETTASSLIFTLLLMAQNSHYQSKEFIEKDGFILNVYKESLRLFPPAYMLVRQAEQQDELCGQKICKGDQIVIAVEAIHRDPRFFNEPQRFMPERFEKNQLSTNAFVPFGLGAKSCIGQRLAYFEAEIILKKILTKFCFATEQTDIFSEPLITLHPKGNPILKFKKREA